MWSLDVSREKKKTFTSTLPGSVYEFWVAEAKEQDVSKNVILAEALMMYKKTLLRQQLKEAALWNYQTNKELAAASRDAQLSSIDTDA